MVIIGLVLSSGEVKTSRAGLELIGNAEGCRRDPYKCPADVWTDGIGNTHGVNPSMRKTDQQIAADWQKNILAAEQCVNRYAAGDRPPQGAFDAAVSITFNVGCATMQKSTMFRLFRQDEKVAACEQFPRWVYAGGVKLNGLVIRCDKECELCLAK
ncbi:MULTISPECIES: lysozyme [Serratia]|uniref:Lysozyme n=1 Tax=Serratia marcescens TaxID=615 RepID=A0A2F0P4T0_SERMA|nr:MULTISPECIES: lysozyme [Serratia]MDF8319680.1 lysozyme [Serratia nevei]MDF8325292.1 lysozyme [Serratia nevei]MDF8337257.1 lysozyme [Serratia nevei]MDF8345143.1 lysozyme [Serratia nevei]MDF8348288.1 lysozyme [Serratia nevei]